MQRSLLSAQDMPEVTHERTGANYGATRREMTSSSSHQIQGFPLVQKSSMSLGASRKNWPNPGGEPLGAGVDTSMDAGGHTAPKGATTSREADR
eukprot:351794-Pyramimonas_sp.AAC.1